jgi:hypothetical protein
MSSTSWSRRWRAALRGARRPWLHARATVAAVLAAGRVARTTRALPLDRAVAALRRGRPFTGALSDPDVHQRVVGVLLPALPPYRAGECLKRSLILLHLWSRCGLEARLHLGARPPASGALDGHAWLTTAAGDGPATARQDYRELFVF